MFTATFCRNFNIKIFSFFYILFFFLQFIHSSHYEVVCIYIFFFSCFGGSVGAPSIPLYARSTMTIYLLWKHNEVINTYTAIMMTKMTHNTFFILFIVSATLWLHLFICKNCNYEKISISISQLPSAQLSNCFSRRADVMSAHAADGLHAEQRRP